MDLIIPLGSESKSQNDELKILLRSVDKNAPGITRVILATVCPPEWIQNVELVPTEDSLKHNKDGNLIQKVLDSIRRFDIHGGFMFSADDNVFVKPCNVEDIPILYNSHGYDYYKKNPRRWHRRMARTFEFFRERGVEIPHSYECHAPQVFDADKVLKGMEDIDYRSGIGLGIYTAFRAVSGEAGSGIEQGSFKSTHENADGAKKPLDRMLAGYNDEAFLNGLWERLLELFPEKSRFERP